MLLGSSSFSSSSLRHHKPKSLGWEVLVGFFTVWFPNLGRSPQAPILAPTLLPSSKHKVVSISSTHSACGGVPWSPSCPFLGLSVSPAPWSHRRARMGHPNLAGFVVKRSFEIWAALAALALLCCSILFLLGFSSSLGCWEDKSAHTTQLCLNAG